MAEVPHSPEDLRMAIAAAMGMMPDRCEEEHMADAYCYAPRRGWERMVLVVGIQGGRAIMEYAVKAASRRHPDLALVAIRRDSQAAGEMPIM